MKIGKKNYVIDLINSTPDQIVYKEVSKKMAKKLERAKKWTFQQAYKILEHIFKQIKIKVMKIVGVDTYKTTRLLFEDHNGNEYTVIHSEDYDDIFTHEFHLETADGDEVEDKYIRQELIDLTKHKLHIL